MLPNPTCTQALKNFNLKTTCDGVCNLVAFEMRRMRARRYQASEREREGEQHVTLACDAVALLHTDPHATC